jgi:CBS domain-containing protein
MRHPTVASVMTTALISVQPQTPFKEIVELVIKHGVSAVPVIDNDGVPVGVVSEADLVSKEEFEGGTDPKPMLALPARRQRWRQAFGLTAAEVMHSPVLTIGTADTVPVAARKLATAGIRRLFVIDHGGRLVGVVSRRDLLRVFLRTDEQLRSEIISEVLTGSLWTESDAVQVAVDNGVVTLSGTVLRRSEADIVARLVQAQPGVVGVVDNLHYQVDDLAAAGAI